MHVGLDDQRQFLHIAGGKLLVQLLERQASAFRQGRFALVGQAVERDLPRFQGIFNHLEPVASLGYVLETQDLERGGRPGLFTRPRAVIQHGAHLAEDRAHDKRVAHVHRAVLDQYRRHRTAAAVEPAFEHRARSQPFGIRFEPLQVRHEQDHLKEEIQILALLCRNGHHHDISAPVLSQ